MPKINVPQTGESGLAHREIRLAHWYVATSGNRPLSLLKKLSFYQRFAKQSIRILRT